MIPYRVYTIGPDGHICAPPIELECHSDHAAMAIAPTVMKHYKIAEVWLGERLVGRVSAGAVHEDAAAG